jgi:hypothetical protein
MKLMLLIHGNGVHNVKQICPANPRHDFGSIKLRDVPDFMSLPVWRDNRRDSGDSEVGSSSSFYWDKECESCKTHEVERCSKCHRFFCIPCHRGAHPEYDVVRDRVQRRAKTGPYRERHI